MQRLYEIKFTGTNELLKLAQQDAALLTKNVGSAITRATLFGITRMVNDCPVDTGRLQASIAGDLAAAAGVDLKSGKIGDGKKQSTTLLNLAQLYAQIGTNVEYALYVEYGKGGLSRLRKPLTPKQRRYLFAVGILKNKKGKVVLKMRRRSKLGGPGFFRKNIPIIERYFHFELDIALKATAQGRALTTW